jgi:hypothetical protein
MVLHQLNDNDTKNKRREGAPSIAQPILCVPEILAAEYIQSCLSPRKIVIVRR